MPNGEDDDQRIAPPAIPHEQKSLRVARAGLQVLGGIPALGGLLSAAAGAWSEHNQDRVNRIFEQWLQMLADELREKEATILEIMERIDLDDEEARTRVESDEFQGHLRKAFRNWNAFETEQKRLKVRNLLANAAQSRVASADIVNLFIDWLIKYSDFHFEVVSAIYNSDGVTRAEIWRSMGRPAVRENSAEADLFKLLMHDLSVGHVIRQHRPTDAAGNFLTKANPKRSASGRSRTLKSAFDDSDLYVLTDLGQQFVHYVLTETTVKVDFQRSAESE